MSFALNPFISFGTQSGGGGSGGTGRITVADAGALYTSVNLAMADGHKVIAVIGETTENASISAPSPGLTLTIDPGANLNMGSGYFDFNANDLDINGNGSITYNHLSSGVILFQGLNNAKLNVENITINNNSAIATCLTNSEFASFSNVKFVGVLKLCANANILDGCLFDGNTIFIDSTSSNSVIDSSILRNVLISDSGVNTLISDCVVY